LGGSPHERSIASELSPTAVAVRLVGAGGPLLSTIIGGLWTLVVLPAALVTSTVRVCGPSRSWVMLRLSAVGKGTPERRRRSEPSEMGSGAIPGQRSPPSPDQLDRSSSLTLLARTDSNESQ
jgi:hypothetical protein